ncbi:hypothetical protein ZWY2020_044298 [Hordeum vulgare]|nr:hypothetical protein ZWY2020_044298 [Hordeum vulgare]
MKIREIFSDEVVDGRIMRRPLGSAGKGPAAAPWRLDYDIENLQIPTRDYACAPSLENICKDLKFINRIALQGNSTYVHCKAGRGRSTTVVLRYLIKYKGMDPKQAWVHTKSIRPRICLTSAQQKAVTLFSTINPVGGDIPSQSSAGVVAHHRPNTRQIQPDPEDHLKL